MRMISAKMRRRAFLRSTLTGAAVALSPFSFNASLCNAATVSRASDRKMRFGLVTYTWGDDWNVPTLISNCEKAKAFGVELRTGHAHGVEPEISAARRQEVKRQFADSQ